jgi:hypothetical protein
MAKVSIAKRLKSTKDFYEDARELCPDLMHLFYGDPNRKNPALLRAADYFKVDLSNPVQSAFLLRILADMAFPERGRTKGTRHWNVERLSKLGQHWLEAEQATPGISDSQAAARIWKKYPKQYQSDEAIRPNLPDARLVSSAASKLLDEKEKTQLEILARSINRASRVANLVIEDLQGAPSREKRRQDLKWVANFFSRVDRAKVHLQEAVKRSQAKAKRLEAKVKKTQAKTASSALIRAGE